MNLIDIEQKPHCLLSHLFSSRIRSHLRSRIVNALRVGVEVKRPQADGNENTTAKKAKEKKRNEHNKSLARSEHELREKEGEKKNNSFARGRQAWPASLSLFLSFNRFFLWPLFEWLCCRCLSSRPRILRSSSSTSSPVPCYVARSTAAAAADAGRPLTAAPVAFAAPPAAWSGC